MITEHLELDSNFKFTKPEFKKPSGQEKLEEYELGRLAHEIPAVILHKVLVNKLRIPTPQVDNIITDFRGDHWRAYFDILVQWSTQTENTRSVRTTQTVTVWGIELGSIHKSVFIPKE